MSKKVAVIDDETDILELVGLHLKKTGFEPILFDNASQFFSYLKKEMPALLILDLMLPDTDGFEVCKKIRSDETAKHLPIIMLTAKAEETDKIIGLELGADDYLPKPFSPRELMARVKAVLRRQVNAEATDVISIKNRLVINLAKFEATLDGNVLDLTPTEFRILKLFAQKPGWVFSREQILDYLWGKDKVVIDRTIDVHVKNLREKLGDLGTLIKNIRGIGYKLGE